MTTSYKGKTYDDRHGGPFDRGMADSYYQRGFKPHFFVGATYASEKVTDLNDDQLEAYIAGFDYNEEQGNFDNEDIG